MYMHTSRFRLNGFLGLIDHSTTVAMSYWSTLWGTLHAATAYMVALVTVAIEYPQPGTPNRYCIIRDLHSRMEKSKCVKERYSCT